MRDCPWWPSRPTELGSQTGIWNWVFTYSNPSLYCGPQDIPTLRWPFVLPFNFSVGVKTHAQFSALEEWSLKLLTVHHWLIPMAVVIKVPTGTCYMHSTSRTEGRMGWMHVTTLHVAVYIVHAIYVVSLPEQTSKRVSWSWRLPTTIILIQIPRGRNARGKATCSSWPWASLWRNETMILTV